MARTAEGRTVAYTDGACAGNPGPGGWAWAVPDGPWETGCEAKSTNQRMEIHAALSAVTAIPGPLLVVSDSTYVVNCFRDRWHEGWAKRGWTNSQKKPVANRDLWEPLIDLVLSQPGRVEFSWVKGHSGDVMNDIVDRLAVEASVSQVPRSGIGMPDALGPADAPGRARLMSSPPSAPSTPATAEEVEANLTLARSALRVAGATDELPVGRRCVVAGVRPPALGGYGETPATVAVRKKLQEVLAAKKELHPDLLVVSGMGLGSEQLGCEAAAAAGVPYAAVLAYPDLDSPWTPSSKAHFRALLDGAAATLVLQNKRPENRQQAGGALARRDAWLASHADEAVVVWDGDDDAAGRQLRTLQERIGEEDVWVIDVPG